MAALSSESAVKAPIFSRERSLKRAQEKLHEIVKPIEAGDSKKTLIRRAHLALLKYLPKIKYSRVKDLFNAEQRISVRDFETEAIMAAWEDWLERSESWQSRGLQRTRDLLARRGITRATPDETASANPSSAAAAAD